MSVRKDLQGEERKEVLEYIAWQLVQTYKKENRGRAPPKLYMDVGMFMVCKALEQKGWVLHLPYAWGLNGVEVAWEDFTSKVSFTTLEEGRLA